MASSDAGWEDVPVNHDSGWEEVPLQPQAPEFKPALDAKGTVAAHLARHGLFGLGDKAIAGVEAMRDVMADKTGKSTLSGAYDRNLALLDQMTEEGDKQHPAAKWIGNGLGVAASLPLGGAVAKGLGLAGESAGPGATLLARARAAAPTTAKLGGVFGAAQGYGSSRGGMANDIANTALGAGAGYVLGGATPYVTEALAPAAKYVGSNAQNLAGWLKAHSLRPVPTVAKAMEEIPGGATGVGKELLQRNIGGLTKAGTARQIDAARDVAGQQMSKIAAAYDSAGGTPVDVTPALDKGLQEAERLQSQPPSAEAGKRLEQLVYSYASKYNGQPVPASEALTMKRVLADYAYKHGKASVAGDVAGGDFGAGMAKIERAADAELDKTLGQQFVSANESFRRLNEAGKAAEKSAERGLGSHVFGLLPHIVGGGVIAAGHATPEAIATGAATTLLGKYGSQLSAKGLYGLGGILNRTPQLAGAVQSAEAPAGARSVKDVLNELRRNGIPVVDVPYNPAARGAQ